MAGYVLQMVLFSIFGFLTGVGACQVIPDLHRRISEKFFQHNKVEERHRGPQAR